MSRNDQSPLLASKIKPPRLSRGYVRRRRLESWVDELDNHLLILINAPSGFGKTMLAAGWAKELRRRSALVSWLSLDQEDNDSAYFLRYLGYAISSAGQRRDGDRHTATVLPLSPLRSTEYIVQLLNHITETGDEFYIFFDDFQSVSEPEIIMHIQFLIQNAPPNLHLVILSRADKTTVTIPKSLVPLELGTAELCFTLEETAALFDDAPQLAQHAIRAHAVTGGWAAALRILVASDPDILDDPLIARRKLCDHQSFAQLLDTALTGLAPQELHLIELISIAVRMCPPLFEELSGIADGHHLIERTEHTNAFIYRLPGDAYWIGCHELVRQEMLSRLTERDPAFVIDVARRASSWYARQGYWNEAVTQALLFGNRSLALKWIEECASKLLRSGDVLSLLSWDKTLRLSSSDDTPDSILLALAFAKILAADRENWESLGELIEKRIGDGLDSRKPNWGWLALYGLFCCRNDDLETAKKVAERGLNEPCLQTHTAIETFRNIAGYSYLHLREWEKFYALPQIPRSGIGSDVLLAATYRYLLFGIGEITQANFSRAQRYLADAYQESCEGLGSSSLPSSLPGTLLAFIHYEKLELNKAEQLLSEHLDVTAASGYIDVIARAYIAASRIAYLRRNGDGALALLDRFEQLVLDSGQIRLQMICAYEKMRFFLAEGMGGKANGCLTRVEHLYATNFEGKAQVRHEAQNYVDLARGQYAMSQNRFADAEAALSQAYRNASSTHDVYMLIVCGTALAVTQCHQGKTRDALALFEKVLAPAQAAGLKASLLYQSAGIFPLLQSYHEHALHDECSWQYLKTVQNLMQQAGPGSGYAPVRLTPREQEILRLVARGMSNKEISSLLRITPETVKGYLKKILAKFDVNRRVTAVTRAISMGLI